MSILSNNFGMATISFSLSCNGSWAIHQAILRGIRIQQIHAFRPFFFRTDATLFLTAYGYWFLHTKDSKNGSPYSRRQRSIYLLSTCYPLAIYLLSTRYLLDGAAILTVSSLYPP